MGISRTSFTVLLLVLLITLSSVAEVYGAGKLRAYQCSPQCNRRCAKTKHRKQSCMEVCVKCCAKCLCVPPGTYGNKQYCPCYNEMKTQQGKPKCP